MEDEPTPRRCRVDILGERLKPGPGFPDAVDHDDELPEGAPEPIQLPSAWKAGLFAIPILPARYPFEPCATAFLSGFLFFFFSCFVPFLPLHIHIII